MTKSLTSPRRSAHVVHKEMCDRLTGKKKPKSRGAPVTPASDGGQTLPIFKLPSVDQSLGLQANGALR